MTNISQAANNTVYTGMQKEKVYATKDTTSDEKIDLNEAGGSIFSKDFEADIKAQAQEISSDKASDAETIIKRFFGENNFSQMLINIINSYSEVAYDAFEVEDSENAADVRTEIDNKVDPQVTGQISKMTSQFNQLLTNFSNKLNNAVQQAMNQLFGQDAVIDENGDVKGKESDKKNFHAQVKDLTYNPDESTAATYSSATSGKNGAKSTGYSNTAEYLISNGARTFEREVNGEKQTVFVFKDENGNKKRVAVDDAGQIHELQLTKKAGKNSYVTTDALNDAKEQQDTSADDMHDVKVKRRKVDGGYQNVMTYTDNDGVKHSVAIETNETTGQTVSTSLRRVGSNAIGRDIYSSDTSGLYAEVSRDGDNIEFDGDRVRTGSHQETDIDGNTKEVSDYASSRKLRKLDAKGINDAVQSMESKVKQKGGTCEKAGNTYTIKLPNGHEYVVDTTNVSAANRTLRMIQGDLDSIHTVQIQTQASPTHVDTTGIVEDSRQDANNIEQNHASTSGNTGVKWGVKSDHTSSDTTNIHSLDGHLGANEGLTQAEFRSQGWYSDRSRTKENDFLRQMDSADIKGSEKSTRNLKTAKEFADRFVKAYSKMNSISGSTQFDTDKLAKAIAAANPSLFDSNGNMYKNADFTRLNLPSKLDDYIKP